MKEIVFTQNIVHISSYSKIVPYSQQCYISHVLFWDFLVHFIHFGTIHLVNEKFSKKAKLGQICFQSPINFSKPSMFGEVKFPNFGLSLAHTADFYRCNMR